MQMLLLYVWMKMTDEKFVGIEDVLKDLNKQILEEEEIRRTVRYLDKQIKLKEGLKWYK